MLGDIMNINKNNKNNLGNVETHLSLKDMIGRYTATMPINCVNLKHKMK